METAYGQFPLSFEQNAGQFEPGVTFAARGDGYSISLRPTEAVLHLREHSQAEPVSHAAAERSEGRPAPERVSVRLPGANPAPRVSGAERLAGVSNYFVGRDPAAWRTNVPTFARVEYASVYPGVDLVYYGNGRQLEYDFRLAPGANPQRIKLEFEGVEGLRLDENGDLLLRTASGGELRQLKPVSYQVIGGERREVESHYALPGGRQAVFELGDYDPHHPLVIDPVVSYSTYLGGFNSDRGQGVVADAAGAVYVVGRTQSPNFPAVSPLKATNSGGTDAFVTKITSSADLVVSISDSPDPVLLGNNLTYTVTITNTGGLPATGVRLTHTLPAGAGIVSAGAGQGSCGGAGPVVCELGTLAGGASANVTVVVTPPAERTLSSTATVTANEAEVVTANNTDTETTLVDFPAPPVRKFEIGPSHVVNEGDGRVTVAVTRTGGATDAAAVDYGTADADTFTVGCADAGGAQGNAFARCDFATSVGTLSFAVGENSKTITVPVIDDAHVEGAETFQLRLTNATGAELGDVTTATITIIDNDSAGAANPITGPPHEFFVRQQYLDFLSREPDAAGFNAWLGVLNTCQPNANTGPEVASGCDRLFVSGEGFFRSSEFSLKGAYAFRFYRVAFGRLPEYSEIVSDMSFVAGATQAEVFARRAQLAARFAQRQEFVQAYGGMTDQQYAAALLGRYNLTQVTAPDPANPDAGGKVVLTAAQLAALPRDRALRAVVDSDEVGAAEFNNTFVAMQYYGYLRRKPEQSGFEAWLRVLQSGDVRTMVNGFLNSPEYKLRFGPQ